MSILQLVLHSWLFILMGLTSSSAQLPDHSIYRSPSIDLSQYQIDHLQPVEYFNHRYNEAVDFLASFLKSSKCDLSVAETVKGGSLGKGTAIRGKCDLDLVTIFNGYPNVLKFKADLPEIIRKLKVAIRHWNVTDSGFTVGIIGSNSRILCITINSSKGNKTVRLRVDIVPAFITTVLPRLYEEMSQQDEEVRSYYSSSLSKLQKEFISPYPPSVKNLIRLVKDWKKTHLKTGPKSYVLELLTIHVWERTGNNPRFVMDRMLKSVFNCLIDPLSINAYWTEYYTQRELDMYSNRTTGKPFIMDPANPFNNIGAKFDWEEISQMARLTANSPRLVNVEPYVSAESTGCTIC